MDSTYIHFDVTTTSIILLDKSEISYDLK